MKLDCFGLTVHDIFVVQNFYYSWSNVQQITRLSMTLYRPERNVTKLLEDMSNNQHIFIIAPIDFFFLSIKIYINIIIINCHRIGAGCQAHVSGAKRSRLAEAIKKMTSVL